MSTNHQGSDQEAVAPKAPVLCEMGCGFFGSDATGNCCSKCWMDKLKKSHAKKTSPPPATTTETEKVVAVIEPEEPSPRQNETTTPDAEKALETPAPAAAAAAAPLKKKKKKKTSYKALMASMTSGTKERDVKKERDSIQGLGGGSFTKVEKI